jgi:hypothetical protein
MTGTKEIKIFNYMGRKSDNSILVSIGELDLYFSYSTIIAFKGAPFHSIIVSENLWGNTTGRHLNRLEPIKTRRIRRDKFEHYLTELLTTYKLIPPPVIAEKCYPIDIFALEVKKETPNDGKSIFDLRDGK